ncbi:SymE family type I addiction module toxin [Limnobaculum parvum]|uniref:Type I toxin-antitoxin system SymE family toxin n=1 Tax=Limnobaculum parvum TaxID=2172103 RepID=A0A2Y9U0T4_9GAMM|nr:SymE family type I addiction module toxin [Limnobaculum parvum]AWH89380.1 type I toxin-antitoxin system SymE family toxin [Limnobaculum parvum]AWH89388.1 type I toxin-antitoxin system SymE family toxin [Limnobaculum parvum]
MAKSDCKSKQTVKAKLPQPRHYTVGYVPNGGKTQPSPQLKISGKWLEALGFTPGQAVTVTTERGRMVIEADITS